MLRSECLRCGVALVPTPYGNICPACEAGFLKSLDVTPEGYALIKKPALIDVGLPKRKGW